MHLYKKHCLEYLNKKLSVIPDIYGEKKPGIKKWSDFCYRMPTEEEVKEWVTGRTKSNIALCLGEISKVVVLDLDTDDKELLKILLPLLPASPVEKIGSKGFSRFFKYSGEETIAFKHKGDVILEILSNGKKTTMPPSMHPNGKPYTYKDKSLLDIDIDSLPKLPPMLVETITSRLDLDSTSTYGQSKNNTGRTNALKSYASGLVQERMPINVAIDRLLLFDKDNNKTPIFSDNSEFQCKDAYTNAVKFYADILNSINRQRTMKGKIAEIPLHISSNAQIVSQNDTSKDKIQVELPQPTGLLKLVYDHILENSFVPQPSFALSAALSLVGTICSRKVVFEGTTPNLYMLNVASSGSGKDSCIQAIKHILKASKLDDLIGATMYPSEASLVVNLPLQPTRLDIIDEASAFLKIASNGKSDYAVGIADTLCELYSCANSAYLGKVLASDGGNKKGACHRPHVNILGATTYRGMRDSVTVASIEKGLFPRFLVFFGDDKKPGRRVTTSGVIKQDILDRVGYWRDFENPSSTGNIIINQPAYRVRCSTKATKLLDDCFAEFDKARVEIDTDNIHRPIICRLYQNMCKIALISAVSNTEIGCLPKISERDIIFAKEMITFYRESIYNFVNCHISEGVRGSKVNYILRIISETGNKGLSNIDIVAKTKEIADRERQEIIKDLNASNRIFIKRVEDDKELEKGIHLKFIATGI